MDKFNFTRKQIESLVLPQKGRAEYADSKINGLQLRVTTSGVKSFVLYEKLTGVLYAPH